MLLVGEDPKKYINDFSNQFQRDFLLLLRTSHGEKKVQLNHFYQEYISNKEHVHMNSTKWPSLTEFAKFLGREGICRVEEDDKGLFVSWVDNSPDALRRQDAIRKKERQDKGDEEREQALIRAQIERAKRERGDKGESEDDDEGARELRREEGEKLKLTFGSKPATKVEAGTAEHSASPVGEVGESDEGGDKKTESEIKDEAGLPDLKATLAPTLAPTPAKVSMKMGFAAKPKNVFAAAKKNALGGQKESAVFEPPRKISEAERIMREEMERKNKRGPPGFGGPPQKKQRY